MGRRGSIAVWIAVMMPGLLIAAALGVEVGNWAAARISVQRAADLAAIAGGIICASNGDCKTAATQQTAATFAARVAQLNGATGTASPSWNSSTSTLTDNMITAQFVTAVGTSPGPALQVKIQKPIPATMSKAFSSTASYTVTGIGTAELVSVTGGTGGGQPCLLALSTSGTDITISGSADITGSNCVVRSDSSIGMSGSSEISTFSVYTAGSISLSGTAFVSATEYTSAGTISDPYSAWSPVQTVVAELGSGGGSAYSLSGSSTATINPGTYTSISLSGSASLTLEPGLYIVNGNISVSGSARVTGSGVTIVTSGSVNISGSAQSTLSAPGTSPTGGAVPGFVFIGHGSSSWSFSGSDGMGLTGVVYAPAASLSYSGSAISSSTGCLEFIVNTATLSGSATLSAGCASYGAPAFNATASTIQSRLVQ